MKPSEIKEILKDKDLFASDKTLDDLTHLYRGNPLALKLIAETIREVFGGNVAAFLNRGETVFGDFHAFLNQQFHRLSEQEKGIMYWLAIGREAVSLEELEADLIPKGSGEDLLAIINSLRRRSMIENSSSVNFALQPVIMEYVTGEFIKHIYSEVEIGRIKLLASHALVKSETKSLVKDNQVRLILTPILERLLKAFGREGTEKKLKEMLSIFHQGSAQIAGYAAINIDHLLTKLYKDSTYDFSSDSGAVLPARSMPP